MTYIKKIYKFYEQVKTEAARVTLPSKQEFYYSLLMIVSVIVLFSFCCVCVDYVIHGLIKFLLNIG